MNDTPSVYKAAENAAEGFEEKTPNAKKQLVRILQVMLYAHAASRLRCAAEEILFTLQ